MKKVRVLTLADCNHCKQFKEAIANTSIQCEILDADDEDELADSVEDILLISNYPIIIMEEGKATTFIYLTNDGAKLGPRRIGTNLTAIGCIDVPSMIKNLDSF